MEKQASFQQSLANELSIIFSWGTRTSIKSSGLQTGSHAEQCEVITHQDSSWAENQGKCLQTWSQMCLMNYISLLMKK